MQDIQIVEKIQRTLTERFNYIVVSIEESKDINCLSVDELQSSLIVHEQKFRRRINEEEQVLRVTLEERRGRGRNTFGGYRGRGRWRSSPAYKAAIECFKCHKKDTFSTNVQIGKERPTLLN